MTGGTSPKTVDVLIGSPRKEFWDGIQFILQGYYPYKMRWVKSVEEILDNPDASFNPVLALIDGEGGTNAANEWTQSTRMTYEKCPILILHAAAEGINFEQVRKNGATEIMHLYYDREFISDMVLQLAPIDMDGDHIPITALMPVDLRDLEIDSEINFDIFVHLPANQKTVLFRKAGAQIEEKSIHKFSHLKQNMYIKKTQMKAFFEYARTVLSARNVAVPVSMTEKFQKSKKSIFTIMSNFMNSASGDFEEGRKITAECLSIIDSFELGKEQTPAAIAAEIGRFTGNTRTPYHDAINIAAYAAFFAQLAELPEEKRREAALAGLLHNIGLSQLPGPLLLKKETEMTAVEKEDYKRYPERSVVMVKNKKVALNPSVSKAIEQHRELGDSTGFPKALPMSDIDDLAKILILAFRFHVMTALENKTASHTAQSTLQRLRDEAVAGSGQYDLVLLNHLFKKIGKL
jgi:HD-GYP domain-containing protein (c-di-GMP phosphodiesterase class II)